LKKPSLFDEFSTVELPANLPEDLLATLKRTRVRQMPLSIRELSAAEAASVPERRRPARPEGGAEGFRAQDGERRPRDFGGPRPQQPGGGYAGKPGGGGFRSHDERRPATSDRKAGGHSAPAKRQGERAGKPFRRRED
jgi:ATP-dependent RNA helicase DeaD